MHAQQMPTGPIHGGNALDGQHRRTAEPHTVTPHPAQQTAQPLPDRHQLRVAHPGIADARRERLQQPPARLAHVRRIGNAPRRAGPDAHIAERGHITIQHRPMVGMVIHVHIQFQVPHGVIPAEGHTCRGLPQHVHESALHAVFQPVDRAIDGRLTAAPSPVPAALRPIAQARQTHHRVVDMPVVAPVGHEDAFGAVRRTVRGHAGDVVPRRVDARQQRVPAVHRGAHILRGAGRGHQGGARLVHVGFVLPVQQDGLVAQPLQRLWMPDRDVGPHHRLQAALLQIRAQLGQVAGVQRADAHGPGLRRRAALAQIEGLVGADVEPPRPEQRRILVDQAFRQRQRLVHQRIKRMMFHPLDEAERTPRLFREFAEPRVAVRAQRHVLMPEGGDGRHQFDAGLRAVFVQFEDVVGVERARAAPGLAQPVEAERVLHVQLQLVVLVQLQDIDQGLQRCGRGHPPAGHVQIVSAHRQHGGVLDVHHGDGRPRVAHQLAERLHAVPQAIRIPAHDDHRGGAIGPPADIQTVGLGGHRGIDVQPDGALPDIAPARAPTQTGARFEIPPDQPHQAARCVAGRRGRPLPDAPDRRQHRDGAVRPQQTRRRNQRDIGTVRYRGHGCSDQRFAVIADGCVLDCSRVYRPSAC